MSCTPSRLEASLKGALNSSSRTPGKPLSSLNISSRSRGSSKKGKVSRNLTPSRNGNLSFSNKTPGKGGTTGDRFCVNRAASFQDISKYAMMSSVTSNNSQEGSASNSASNHNRSSSAPVSPNRQECQRLMSESLNSAAAATGGGHDVSMAGQEGSSFKIMSFQTSKAPPPPIGFSNGNSVLYSSRVTPASSCKKAMRHIPSSADRVLDAPEIHDDYYLNLIDWSSTNFLAVALHGQLYLWNATSGDIQLLSELPEMTDYYSSVQWSPLGNYIACALSTGVIELFDASTKTRLRSLPCEGAESGLRIASMSWNQHVLSTGSQNGAICHWDVRVPEALISTVYGHQQEVCGLRWSPDGRFLASGGNDNLLQIWPADPQGKHAQGTPIHSITHHQAAVKALSWCPWQPTVLASGGGTADRHIRIWNVNSGALLEEVDTESQVSSILWNSEYKELISSHGMPNYQLSIWKYPKLTKITELTGHTGRVLSMCGSPDGERVVSVGADECLRIWTCFAVDPNAPGKSSKDKLKAKTSLMANHSTLRQNPRAGNNRMRTMMR